MFSLFLPLLTTLTTLYGLLRSSLFKSLRYLMVCVMVSVFCFEWALWVVAQEEPCDACNSTPSFIDDYISVAYDLQKALPVTTICGNWDFLKWTGWFSLWALTQWLRSNMTSYVTKVIWWDNRLWNVFWNYKMLWRSRAVVRDWNKLLEIDAQIAKLGCWVVKQELLFESPPLAIYKTIDTSLAKLEYLELGKSWNTSYNMMNNGKNYGDVVLLLRQMNQYYKKLFHNKFYTQQLETVWTDQKRSYWMAQDLLDDKQENEHLRNLQTSLWTLEKRLYGSALNIDSEAKSNKYVYIDDQKLAALVREAEIAYRCADGKTNQCPDGTKWIRDKNRELISDHTKHDRKRSLDTFKIATNRLKWILVESDTDAVKAAQQRKDDLLTWFRWKRVSTEKRFEWLLAWPASSISQFASQLWKWFRSRSIDPIQDFWNDATSSVEPSDTSISEPHKRIESTDYKDDEYRKAQTEKIADAHDERDEIIWWTDNQLQINQNTSTEMRIQKDEIRRIFSVYLKDRANSVEKELSHFNTRETTSTYAWVSMLVHKSANMFWDYDKQKESINSTLLQMCYSQCEWLEQKKCRSDHQ